VNFEEDIVKPCVCAHTHTHTYSPQSVMISLDLIFSLKEDSLETKGIWTRIQKLAQLGTNDKLWIALFVFHIYSKIITDGLPFSW